MTTVRLAKWWSAEALLPAIRNRRTLVAEDADGRVVGMAAHLDGNTGARGFYESRGFRVTGSEPDPLGGPDNVWMELSLG